LTKNYSRNSKEKDLEAGAEQVLLEVMKRRMNPLVAKVIEEEMIGRGRGFRRGKGKYIITFYRYGVEGHKASECLEKHNSRKRGEA
jgi:hypothetical protein